jgi:ribulose-5-phosphate 4-epimerase/fuculose-1-phosphate aldolase
MSNVAPLPRSEISAEERALRVQLAAAYRIFALLGWTELIYNHITLRVPGPERHFLINPFGLHYSEVTASNLVKIDLEGRPVSPTRWPVNPAGFTVHAAIHAGIEGAHCVMHTHTTAGMAVACSQAGLSMSNFYSAQLHGKVAYHDFEGITVHSGEGPRLLKSIGSRPAVILRNHGLLAWGDSLPRSFAILWLLQPGLRNPTRLDCNGPGDRDSGRYPEEMHGRFAAIRSALRRGAGRVRRAHAHDRQGRSDVSRLRPRA